MGFSFSRAQASGGGGGVSGVKRLPQIAARNGFGTAMYWAMFNGLPTSPTQLLNTPFQGADTFGNASPTVSYSASVSQYTLNFSITNNYWFDLLGFEFHYFTGDANVQSLNLILDGNTYPIPKWVGGTGFNPPYNFGFVDMYGYGLSASIYISLNTSAAIALKMAPLIPNTVVSSGGSVVWPPSLTGISVLRAVSP